MAALVALALTACSLPAAPAGTRGDTSELLPSERTPRVSISPDQIRAVAEAALPRARDLMLRDTTRFPHYGFNTEQELARATVGTPAEYFTLWPQELHARQPGQVLASLVRPAGWYVPITVDGDGRNMIMVAFNPADGTWDEVGCCEELSTSHNLTVIQQHYLPRNAAVKTIFVEEPLMLNLAWITEDQQEILILLEKHSDPGNLAPGLWQQVMKPYPAEECLTELARSTPFK